MKQERKKILILGGGFGGIYTLKHLHKLVHSDKLAEIALVGEKNYFLFTPLLHEVATGGLYPGSTTEPVRKFLGCCPNTFHLGTAKVIHTASQTVEVDGSFLPYDYLVIATGAETNFYKIPGAEQYALPLKSIEDAVAIKNHILRMVERAANSSDKEERKKLLTFVVVGGGPTGVELVAEIEELIAETLVRYYPPSVIDEVSILLIQRDKSLVPQFNERIREKSLQVLKSKNIRIMLETAIREVGHEYAVLEDGLTIPTHTVIWVAGIKPKVPEFDIRVERSPDGRILVNEFFEVSGQKNVFAIGDVAALPHGGSFLPALAQVAEKEGRALGKNLTRILRGGAPEPFLYEHSGVLLSLGQWMAAAEIKGFTFYGRFAWWVWRTIYLFKFISWRKKIRVAVDWTVNLFSPRDISEL